MLARFIAKSSHLRYIALISSHTHLQNLKPRVPDPLISNPSPFIFSKVPRFYSNGNNNGKDSSTTSTSHLWNISSEADESIDPIFGEEPRILEGLHDEEQQQMKPKAQTQKWKSESLNDRDNVGEDIFEGVKKDGTAENDGWATAEGYKAWTLGGYDSKEVGDDLFDIGEGDERQQDNWDLEKQASGVVEMGGMQSSEEEKNLEIEETNLTEILNGPNRAFGDLIAASGITDEMLDSLIALKDFDGIPGLPPLWKIEDNRYEKNTRKSTRAEIERQKQEEVANARVQQVDDKGRAYGTGRRKCSIARVWVQPGEGKFTVNEKEFDVYFPMLDHRAMLLRPFSETKTLGMWDVNCTVKGGGVSGQVGAIRLGISRALQSWAPDLRRPLRAAGFLTRDSRVVERKKPGKAKARKSFQWVKR